MFNIKDKSLGFTLIEMMVVIAVVGILSSVVYASFGQARAQARDKIRVATMKELQLAIQLYKNENGEYPEGCRGPGSWSGNVKVGTYKCASTSDSFIRGLVPDFLAELPKDPQYETLADNLGYIYITNAARDAYKLLAYSTIEAADTVWGGELARCPSNCVSPSNPCTTGHAEYISTFSKTLAVYSSGEFMCK